MTGYILYGHRTSGHSYKVALTLRLLGIDYDYRDVDLTLARHKRPADWRAASRFGEVPVLVGPRGPVSQSNAILLQIARAHRSEFWDARFDEITSWLFWEANRIGHSLPNYRVARRERGPDDPVTASLESRLMTDLATMEVELRSGSPFLLGPRISVADISCAAYLLMDDNPASLDQWPAVEAWLGRIRSLPASAAPRALMPSPSRTRR